MKNILLCLLCLIGCSDYHISDINTEPNMPQQPIVETPAEYQEDRFIFPPQEQLDILMVVDKSCSMNDNFYQLFQSTTDFIDTLEAGHVDYQIGVASMNAPEGYYNTGGKIADYYGDKVADPYDEDPYARINDLIGSAQGVGEQGIDSTFAATTWAYEYNKPLFRHSVPLHIMIISDEQDGSFVKTPWHLTERLEEVSNLKNAPITLSTIVHPEATSLNCDMSFGASSDSIGYKYLALNTQMNGTLIDICNVDWGRALEQVKYLFRFPNQYYYLSEFPDTDSIQLLIYHNDVVYAPQRLVDWFYSEKENSIFLIHFVPALDDEVVITYKVR